MKKNPFVVFGLIAVFISVISSCDKDDHYYENDPAIASETKDSLTGNAWLQNGNGEVTNIFNRGDDIYIYTSLQNHRQKMIFAFFDECSLKIYQNDNNSFLGYPQLGMDDLIRSIWFIPSKETRKEFVFVPKGMMEKNVVLPKGEYILNLELYATLYDVDTLNLTNLYDKVIEKDTFSNLKIRFRIK